RCSPRRRALSLHDALPICRRGRCGSRRSEGTSGRTCDRRGTRRRGGRGPPAAAGRRRPVKGFGNLMREAQRLQQQMAAVQEEVAQKKVQATAGGGMVTVEANGKQEIVSIKIDPEVINKDDAQMLEDLVLAASNEALRKARELVQQELGKLTGGLKIPGLGL